MVIDVENPDRYAKAMSHELETRSIAIRYRYLQWVHVCQASAVSLKDGWNAQVEIY